MDSRLNLQKEFLKLCNNVYFQPPATVTLKYPAIVYSLRDFGNSHADDGVYRQNRSYNVVVIDRNPESTVAEAVSKMQSCRFDRFYAADGLNHFAFSLFYNNNKE